MTNLASSVTWGSSYGSPTITVSFDYEYQRSGPDMQYRIKTTVNTVSGARYFGYPIYQDITLDGTKAETKTLKSASPSQWSSAIVYTSSWFTVKSKTTGTTALSVKLYSGMGSSRTETYSYSLSVSPAASAVSAASGNIGSTISIAITRYSTSFTHTLTYSFAGKTGTIASGSTAGTVSWTPPMDLCSAIPSATSGKCTITCTTKSGSTTVGTASTQITLSVPSDVVPTLSDGAVSIAPYSDNSVVSGWAIYLQSYSGVQATFDDTKISGAYGSTITAKSVSVDGKVYSSPFKSDYFTAYGTKTLTATITDSRGRTAKQSVTFEVLPYSKPSLSNPRAERSTAGGTASEAGTSITCCSKISYSSCGGANVCLLTAQYRTMSGTWGEASAMEADTPLTIGDGLVSIMATYEAKISVVDSLGNEDTFTAVIPTGFATFNAKAGGKGVAFFKYAETDGALEIGGDISISGKADVTGNAAIGGSLTIGGNAVADYVIEQGVSDVWTYRKWANGVSEVWGRQAFTDLTTDESWGGFKKKKIGNFTFPDGSFTEMPVISWSASISNFPGHVYYDQGSTPNYSGTFALAGLDERTVSGVLNIYAVGKWK